MNFIRKNRKGIPVPCRLLGQRFPIAGGPADAALVRSS